MTTQLPNNSDPIINTSYYLLPIATLSCSLFMGTAMAAGGSNNVTSIQSISTNTTVTPSAAPTIQTITPKATTQCPLNSGGPSLLGTTWVVETLYGHRVPQPLKMDMRVSTHALSGKAGCNKYSATFNRVGYTGFKVRQIVQTKNKCKVLIPYKTAKSIDVGRIEGSYLRILRRMGSVRQMENGKLNFFDRNGKVGLILRKIGDENKQAQAVAAPTPKKVVAPKTVKPQTVIKKAVPAPVQQQKTTPQKEEEEQQPLVRKINASDNDLISNFFKKIGF